MLGQPKALGWVAFVAAALGCLRILVMGYLDRRPHSAGAEAGDIGVLLRNHLAYSAPDGPDVEQLLHLLQLEHHQPPLYYGGVPALYAPFESLSFGGLQWVNAVALAVALGAAWAFGRLLGRPRLGLLAVLTVVSLRLVAGRFTMLGVEPLHMALVGVMVVQLLRLRQDDATLRHAVGLGVVVGVALLLKLPFIAAAFGPLLLELVHAIRGGAATRRWLRHLFVAAGVVVLLLAVGFVPLAGTLHEFLLMTQTEPTHETVFSWASVLSMGDWCLLGLGPGGLLISGLAAFGAIAVDDPRGRPPDHGCHPALLLAASVVSLLVIHGLIPHKEIRYLVPAAWPFAALVAMGLDRLWLGGLGARRAVIGSVGLLWTLTFIVSSGAILGPFVEPSLLSRVLFDPQVPHERSESGDVIELEPPLLRLWLDRSDYGLDSIARHPSFADFDRPLVVASLEDPRFTVLRATLEVELYLRNDPPVRTLPYLRTFDRGFAARDLARATHVVSNRRLSPSEREAIGAEGFREVAAAAVHLAGPKWWQLWVRQTERLEQTDFEDHLDGFAPWPGEPDTPPPPHQLLWSSDSEGRPGHAAMLRSEPWAPPGAVAPGVIAMQKTFGEFRGDVRLGFDWRAYSEGPGAPRVWVELADGITGRRLHRRTLTLPGIQDTGWIQLPPTAFPEVDAAEPGFVTVRIGLEVEPGAPPSVLLVDNLRLDAVRRKQAPIPQAPIEGGPEVWSPWLLGSPDSGADVAVAAEPAGESGAMIGATNSLGMDGQRARFGLQRKVPVTHPFALSLDWRTQADGGGPPPDASVELLGPGRQVLHSWRLESTSGAGRYESGSLSEAVGDLPEVLLRVGVVPSDEPRGGHRLWVGGLASTQPCDSPRAVFADRDRDGFGDPAAPFPAGRVCHPTPGWVEDSSDCDDRRRWIQPGAPEICDGQDSDCDPATTMDGDIDADGDGGVVCAGDCDDDDPSIHPAAIERCDDVDSNCDQVVEDETTDVDQDGYPLCDGDCDDGDPDVWPGANEICSDGIDQDCDGEEARDGSDSECRSPPPPEPEPQPPR